MGKTPTCVRPQGWSVIDLSWGSADLSREVTNWKVEENIESLLDHQYITMDLGPESQLDRNKRETLQMELGQV